MTDSTWAAPLAPYQLLSDAFGETIRNSVFDRVLADAAFLRVPAMVQVAVTSAGMSATVVGEANTKPATQLSLTSVQLTMSKVSAFVVVSSELMRGASAGALALLGRELRNAVASVTDTYFFQQLMTGLVAIPSAGASSLAVRNDIRALMDATSFGSDARLYFIAPPTIVKRLGVLGDSAGGKAFQGLTPVGGQLDGVPLLTSDVAPAGTLTLADMSQCAVAAGPIVLDRSDVAALQLDTVGDSPPAATTVYQSLWPQNLSALRAERFLSVQRMRTTAVAQISGATGLGNSPS
jgi:HK97 family phage major capsid protein